MALALVLLLVSVLVFIALRAALDDLAKRTRQVKPCILCEKPGMKINLKQITGLLLGAEFTLVDDYLCANHCEEVYNSFFSHNIKKGWWSIMGPFRTPLILISNRLEKYIYDKNIATKV